jgi:hypothetical protein
MEAHAGTIGIRTGHARKQRRDWLTAFVDGARRRRQERARRAHALRLNGASSSFVPGSEHTHVLQRPRGF